MAVARLTPPSIRHKLFAAFASTLLILVVVWVGVEAIGRTEAARYWADRAVLVRSHAHAILNRLLEARLARATYVISGDPALLAEARNLRTVTDSQIHALGTLTGDNPQQQVRLVALAPYLEHEVAGMEESLEHAEQEDLDSLTSLVLKHRDRSNFALLEEALEEIAAEEDNHIEVRTEIARERTDTARTLLIVGGGLAFLLMIYVISRIGSGIQVLERASATIAEQANELATRGQQLERSLKELDEFAYVASHDLRAPLRAIASLASWIEEDNAERLDDEGREHLRLLVSRVARMEALVQGVLDYARAGRSKETAEDIDAGALVGEVIDLLEVPEGTEILVETALPTVRAARIPFQQIWMNLLSNAIKYGAQPGTVRVGANAGDDGPVFYVADDGPGIDPQYHDRIFQLFQTLRPRDEVEATGIGLSVVKKLVESQGGRVWLESAPGEGTTFRFTYPPSNVRA